MLPIPPVVSKIREDMVFAVGAEFQLFAHVHVERRHERATDRGFLRIVVGKLPDQIVGGAGEACIQAPGRQAAAPLQFLHELGLLYAQVRFQDVLFTKSGVVRHFLCHGGLLGARKRTPLQQRGGILSFCKRSGFL